jgi:hypothetical protein
LNCRFCVYTITKSIFYFDNTALELLLGDVLDAKTDALLLTVDGMTRNIKNTARPIRGSREILGGNIANQFAKRWPDDRDDMQSDIPFQSLKVALIQKGLNYLQSKPVSVRALAKTVHWPVFQSRVYPWLC